MNLIQPASSSLPAQMAKNQNHYLTASSQVLNPGLNQRPMVMMYHDQPNDHLQIV
jgi:hypothetical protein